MTIDRPIRFFLFLVLVAQASAARDTEEKSVTGLRDALVALAPSVDRAEADTMSVTAHAAARDLVREYHMVSLPSLHNFFIHIGLRQRGFCFDWSRDIGARLKALKLKTLTLHWGAAFPGTERENNCLVITARGQPFQQGIILDGWRRAGRRLWWSQVGDDTKYEWDEDMAETAWLQDARPIAGKPAAGNVRR